MVAELKSAMTRLVKFKKADPDSYRDSVNEHFLDFT